MLGFWLGGLKWAGQDANLRIYDFLWHLRMAYIFVN